MKADTFCLICRENGGKFLTHCDHRFHKTCLKEWLKTSKTGECPLCRRKVSASQVFEHLKAKRWSFDDYLDTRPIYLPFPSKVLEWMAQNGDIEEFKNVINSRSAIRHEIDMGNSLREAIRGGHIDLVKLIMTREDHCPAKSFYTAVEGGNSEIMK